MAAMPVLSAPEIPHLRESGFIREVDHPKIGKRLVFGPPWKISDDASYTTRRGPPTGEQNDYAFRELLVLSEEEISSLVEQKVIA